MGRGNGSRDCLKWPLTSLTITTPPPLAGEKDSGKGIVENVSLVFFPFRVLPLKPQQELCQICETPSSLFLLARMCEMLAGYMLGEWKARKAQ